MGDAIDAVVPMAALACLVIGRSNAGVVRQHSPRCTDHDHSGEQARQDREDKRRIALWHCGLSRMKANALDVVNLVAPVDGADQLIGRMWDSRFQMGR